MGREDKGKKEHLFSITKKDLKIQTFRSGGKGGQHQNKTNSGVRIIHEESGCRGESREERSQAQNKRVAFRRLISNPKFKLWVRMKAKEIIDEKTLEQKIDEMMESKKDFKIEVKDEKGKWITKNV